MADKATYWVSRLQLPKLMALCWAGIPVSGGLMISAIKTSVWVLLFSVSAFTASVSASDLRIDNAEIRLPLPGQTTAVVYLALVNSSPQDLTVSDVRVEGAGAAQLHQHIHRDGMMRMRHLESISVAAGETLTFESGSYHIMAFRMAARDGKKSQNATYAVTLIMSDGQKVSAQATPTTL